MTEPFEILVAYTGACSPSRAEDRAKSLAQAQGGNVTRISMLATEEMRADGDMLTAPSATALSPRQIADIADERDSDLVTVDYFPCSNLPEAFSGSKADRVLRHARRPVLVVRRSDQAAYDTVIVATNFSATSLAALLLCGRLLPDARIVVVHAYHVPYEAWLNSPEARAAMREEARHDMERFLSNPMISPALRGRITVHLDEGDFETVIARCIEKTGPQLLALGTSAKNPIIYWMLGSHSESIINASSTDVLVLHG